MTPAQLRFIADNLDYPAALMVDFPALVLVVPENVGAMTPESKTVRYDEVVKLILRAIADLEAP